MLYSSRVPGNYEPRGSQTIGESGRISGSKVISSRRFRVRQYILHLEDQGRHVTGQVAGFGSWLPDTKVWRPLWFPATVLDRGPGVMQFYQHDVTLLQCEMVSMLATLERFAHHSCILDVDDAAGGGLCLRQRAGYWNGSIQELPTVVGRDEHAAAL